MSAERGAGQCAKDIKRVGLGSRVRMPSPDFGSDSSDFAAGLLSSTSSSSSSSSSPYHHQQHLASCQHRHLSTCFGPGQTKLKLVCQGQLISAKP